MRAHGIVVCRWFGLYQTALLTPRPAPGLQTVATAWDLIRGSLTSPHHRFHFSQRFLFKLADALGGDLEFRCQFVQRR